MSKESNWLLPVALCAAIVFFGTYRGTPDGGGTKAGLTDEEMAISAAFAASRILNQNDGTQPKPEPRPEPQPGDVCPSCNGTGKSGDGHHVCGDCGGSGVVGDPFSDTGPKQPHQQVVQLGADWCGACKKDAEEIESWLTRGDAKGEWIIGDGIESHFRLLDVSSPEAERLMEEADFHPQSIPAYIHFLSGEIIETHMGSLGVSGFRRVISRRSGDTKAISEIPYEDRGPVLFTELRWYPTNGEDMYRHCLEHGYLPQDLEGRNYEELVFLHSWPHNHRGELYRGPIPRRTRQSQPAATTRTYRHRRSTGRNTQGRRYRVFNQGSRTYCPSCI